MATAAEILSSPDYINANPATKQAIFEKHIATTPAFANANEATQAAIRSKFGLPSLAASEVPQGRSAADQIPGIMPQVPRAPEPSVLDKIRGVLETGAGVVSGAVTAPIVAGSEVLGALTSGQYGTPEGVRAGENLAKRVAQQIQYQPRTTTGQEYLQATGNALADTGLQGVPLNVLAGAQQTMRPVAQAVGDAGAARLAQRAQNIAQTRSTESWQRAPQIEAAQAAQRLGVAVNPAASNPTMTTRALVGATGEAVVNAKAAKANAPKWNQIARQDLGLPENTPLTTEAFETARAAHSAPYDAIRQIPQLSTTGEVTAQLEKLRLDPLSTSDPAKAAKVNGIIDRVIGQTDQGLSGENAIGQIRGFRKDATRVLKNPNASPIEIDVAESQLGIANALENLLEANISNPRALDEFRAARTAIAKTYNWERATGITTKQVDPIQIAKMAEKGAPLSGTLADVANIAGNFPEIANLSPAKEPLLYQRLRRGGAGGTIGFALGGGPAGAAVGAGLTSLGSEAVANVLARPSVQNRLAQPRDFRIPLPQEPGAPFQPIPQGRAVVPYDYSQQAFTPPNFTIVPEQYGPRVTPVAPDLTRALPAPSAEGTMNALRAEDVRRAGISRAVGQEAEARTAAAEAAARKPAAGEVILELDPVTGRLREASQGIKGATPETFSNFGSALETASSKVASGKPFDLTAAEKVAWEKTRVDLAEVAPGFQALNDKAIAAKMMDRQWISDTLQKAREKAKAFEQIAARAKDERTRQQAQANRERMMSLAEEMEQSLGRARPVSGTTQGPKTREHIRNQLAGQRESMNKLMD